MRASWPGHHGSQKGKKEWREYHILLKFNVLLLSRLQRYIVYTWQLWSTLLVTYRLETLVQAI